VEDRPLQLLFRPSIREVIPVKIAPVSASSSRSRLASGTSIPPYLARHL
jgi:hypothetical protein